MPSVKAPVKRAPQIADAAEHHDHEAVDDVALAEVRADIVDLREGHAGDAGDARAQPEGHGIDPAGADAHGRGHAPVLGDRAHLQAERRGRITASRPRSTTSAEDDDPRAGSR